MAPQAKAKPISLDDVTKAHQALALLLARTDYCGPTELHIHRNIADSIGLNDGDMLDGSVVRID